MCGAFLVLAVAAPAALAGDEVFVFSDGNLSVVGDVGKNRITVDRSASTFTITDPDANFTQVHNSTPGGSCTGEGTHKLVCDTKKLATPEIRITGGAGDDELTILTPSANPGTSNLAGGLGKDTLSAPVDSPISMTGEGGDDLLKGGPAGQTLNGGDGDDTIQGGGGDDTLDGDRAATFPGKDNLDGGPGDDTLKGGAKADVIDGGENTDRVDYQDHPQGVVVTLDGQPNDGNNSDEDVIGTNRDSVVGVEDINGSPANDLLFGDSARNSLNGEGGNDRLSGAGDNDNLAGNKGADLLEGGPGTDAVFYNDHALPLVLSIGDGLANDGSSEDGAAGARDNIANDIESLFGASQNDTLIGNALANTLFGGGGDDTLDGRSGPDSLGGGEGRDTATYASRTLPVTATLDGVANDGQPFESDNIQSGTENVTGGSADDNLTGDDNANRLSGGLGNDLLTGKGGDDLMLGGLGNDVQSGDAGVDTVSYADHTQPVTVTPDGVANDGQRFELDNAGGGGVENIIGGSGDDTLTGNAAANKIVGGQGADTLNGLGGDDRLQSAEDPITVAGQTFPVPVADKSVDCDGGADTAVRDLEDIKAGMPTIACETFEDAPVGEHPTIRLSRRARYVPRRHAVRLVLACPRRYKQRSCRGRVSAKLGRKRGRGFASRRFRLRRRHHRVIYVHIRRGQLRALRRGRVLRVVVSARDRKGRAKRTTRLYKRERRHRRHGGRRGRSLALAA